MRPGERKVDVQVGGGIRGAVLDRLSVGRDEKTGVVGVRHKPVAVDVTAVKRGDRRRGNVDGFTVDLFVFDLGDSNTVEL